METTNANTRVRTKVAAVWPETAKRIDIIAFTSALPRRIQRFSKLLHSVPQLLYF